jgi:hypothetical protein
MAMSGKRAHFPQDIILMGVRWDVAYPLSTRRAVPRLQREGGGELFGHGPVHESHVVWQPVLEWWIGLALD